MRWTVDMLLIVVKRTSTIRSLYWKALNAKSFYNLSTCIACCALTLLGFGCGSQSSKLQSGKVCQESVSVLKQRIGPEFDKLISVTPLPIPSASQYGCVLTFTKILEELPGEVVGQYISSAQPHELAFLIPDSEGRLVLSQPPIPSHRQDQVTMQVKLAEVHDGGHPEVMVEERDLGSRTQVYGLRIFLYAEGVPVPKEIFSERMSIKNSSGVERVAELLIGSYDDFPALFLKSSFSKKERIYMWHESLQKYRFDLSATQRRALSRSASKKSLRPRKASPPRVISKEGDKKMKPSSIVDIVDVPKSSAPSSSKLERRSQVEEPAPIQERDLSRSADSQVQEEGVKSKPKGEEKVTTVNEFLEGL